MKLFIRVSSTFTILLLMSSQIDSLIITEHSPEIIATYYRYLYQYFKGDLGPKFQRVSYFPQYCHELRLSKHFITVHTPQNPQTQTPLPSMRTITNETLQEERNQTQLTQVAFRVAKLTRIQLLPSFICLNIEGTFELYITPAFIKNSAFLFKYNQGFRYVSWRVVTGKKDIYSKLSAIVDEPAEMTNNQDQKLPKDRFLESLKSTNSSQPDALCDTKRIIKYRLCAVVVDLIRTYPITIFDIEAPFSLYPGVDMNHYYQPPNLEESCPTLNLTEIGVSRKMLYCSIYSLDTRTRYQFYLSLNSLNTSEVFTIRHNQDENNNNDNNNTSFTIDSMEVPLLRHLDQYQKALRDANI